MSNLAKFAYVAVISMVPVIELRGAIPVGLAMGLPLLPTLLVAIIGNMFPIPFVLLLVEKVFGWMRNWGPFFVKIVDYFEGRAKKNTGSVKKYGEALGLMVFVAIPLPGTGAWTGALIASMLHMKKWKLAFPAIFLGVVIAGLVVCAVSYGIGALFS